MNKIETAKIISTITNPPIICIPLFLIITITLSFENGTFDPYKFIILESISIVFASVLPMAIILFWARKLGTDKDISNRTDRFTPLIVGIISYFIGFIVSFAVNADAFLTILLLCYSINTGVVCLITTKWKISVHTTGLSGPVGALILLIGPAGALFGIIYPILIWSRVSLEKHTLAQAICGAIQGFFLTVLEFYLFMNLFNMNIAGLTPLTDSICFILAIIFTPILLGILSYGEFANKKIMFYVFEIIGLALFFVLTPISVFGIYVLVSSASIIISYLAGDDFIWFNVLFN